LLTLLAVVVSLKPAYTFLQGRSPIHVFSRPAGKGNPLQIKTYTFVADFDNLCSRIRREFASEKDFLLTNDGPRGTFYIGRYDKANRRKVWGVLHVYKHAKGDRSGSFRAMRGWVTVAVYDWEELSVFERATSWLTSQS
jgi:hypothetical protein